VMGMGACKMGGHTHDVYDNGEEDGDVEGGGVDLETAGEEGEEGGGEGGGVGQEIEKIMSVLCTGELSMGQGGIERGDDVGRQVPA